MATSARKRSASTEEPNRRGDIVRAAGRLFAEKGYAATTIRDIARAVDMQSGSPFYHFKTKHDMLRAVVLEGIAAINDAVIRAANSGGTPRATFEAMLRPTSTSCWAIPARLRRDAAARKPPPRPGGAGGGHSAQGRLREDVAESPEGLETRRADRGRQHASPVCS
jgi:AcrR family transcriptional regulator